MCKNTDSAEAATTTTTTDNNNGTTASDDNAGQVLTTSAFPPWHTVALIGLLLAHFIAVLPASLASMDHAHKTVFLHVNFPHLLDVEKVGWIRLFLGSVMIVDTVYAFLYGKWEQDTEYYYP